MHVQATANPTAGTLSKPQLVSSHGSCASVRGHRLCMLEWPRLPTPFVHALPVIVYAWGTPSVAGASFHRGGLAWLDVHGMH